MKEGKLKIIVIAGTIAFVGIIAMQIYLLRQAFDYEEKKFSQNIQISLFEVANEINKYYGYQSPPANCVEKINKDYYIVNLKNDFEAKVLELVLTNKFKSKNIRSNFEYAIYDCETDAMLYGQYVNIANTDTTIKSSNNYFPKAKHLVYYFAVRFPNINTFIYASLHVWIALSIVMLIALCIYLYAMYIIVQQQKYANLQKDFINNMTHEFKTPLASILIASKYLSQHNSVMEDEKLLKYSHIITDQGKKLDSHLEKILQVAKSDTNPDILQKTPINIATTIQKVIEIIQLKHKNAVVEFTTNDEQMTILADEFHFTNMMYNFLDNAVKYCDTVPFIQIEASQTNKIIHLQIKDNGIGIAPKFQKLVFNKFYRVPTQTAAVVNGFGLGLYYVQKICLLHHWKIFVESAVGKGTTINVQIAAI